MFDTLLNKPLFKAVKMTFLNFFLTSLRSSQPEMFCKKMCLQENNCDGLQLTKTERHRWCFPVNFTNISRTSILQNTLCDWLTNRSTYHQDHHHHLQYLCSVSVLLAWNYRIHYLISLLDWSNFSGKTCIFDLVITWHFENLERINIQVKQVFSNIQIWSF